MLGESFTAEPRFQPTGEDFTVKEIGSDKPNASVLSQSCGHQSSHSSSCRGYHLRPFLERAEQSRVAALGFL